MAINHASLYYKNRERHRKGKTTERWRRKGSDLRHNEVLRWLAHRKPDDLSQNTWEGIEMLAIKARIMLDKLVSSLRKEEGQGLVEYGLILALVAVVVVGALTTMGQNLLAKLQVVVTNLV